MTSTVPEPVSIDVGTLRFDGLEWRPPAGPRATALLLHGFPQRCTSWAGVGAGLAAAGVRAVAPDLRGYSPGARPSDVAAYGMPALVGDVVGMLRSLGAGTGGAGGAGGAGVHLVGHDWGAVVGWQVAARHPELVRSWTAVSTPNQQALDTVLAGSDADATEQREAFGYMREFRREGAAARLLADDAAGLRDVYDGRVTSARVDEDVAFFARPCVLDAALAWYCAMRRDDSDGLSAVRVPTTYVWGDQDRAFRARAAHATGAHVAADYRFVPLPGIGHWVPDEAHPAVCEAVLERIGGA